jgi:hypothetical protein
MKLIPINKLFDIRYGTNLELVNLEQCTKIDLNSINFISRTEYNNGISAFVFKLNDVVPNPSRTISVAGGGSVLSSFYQKEIYYSGRDIYILIPKEKMTELEMLFYAFCLTKNKYKYSYGRQVNKTLKDILVPDKISDEYKNIDLKKINTLKKEKILNKIIDLNIKDWKFFTLNNLFKITGSKTTPLSELEEYGIGKYPFVTTQATNNGVAGFYNFYTEEENILTIDSAVLGYCSYQPEKFSASDHVEKLMPKFNMNKYIAMFLITILNLEQYRYNYGRKCSQDRMEQIKIKLPSKNNEPDWQFMENYIKSLSFSATL